MAGNVSEAEHMERHATSEAGGPAGRLAGADGGERRLRRLVLLSLAIWTVMRALLAAFAPLGVDENYAIAAAREFSWSFFDHPPLGFWLPVAMVQLAGIEHPIIFRLPFLAFGTGSAWLLWRIGARLAGPQAGFWAMLFLLLSPIFSILSGLLVVPDGPLDVFVLLTVWLLLEILRAEEEGRPVGRLWLAAGMALAPALMSKYQAGLVPVSLLLYMLVSRRGRAWLGRPWPWLGAAVAGLGLLPVLVWNLQNDWASFTYQGGRAGGGLSLANFARMLVAQALYLVPSVMLAALLGLAAGVRGRFGEEGRLLALVAIGPIVMFNLVYLATPTGTLPHWALPGWLVALPLGAVWALGNERLARWSRRLTLWFGAALWVGVIVLVLHARTGFLTRSYGDTPPAWDNTIALFDWSGLLPALEARGLLDEAQALAVLDYIEGGAMATALHDRLPVYPLGGIASHHFLFHRRSAAGGPGLLLVPATRRAYDRRLAQALDAARRVDPKAEALAPVVLGRGGVPYAVVGVIRLDLPPRRPGLSQASPRGKD